MSSSRDAGPRRWLAGLGVPKWRWNELCCTVLYCTVLYCTVLYNHTNNLNSLFHEVIHHTLRINMFVLLQKDIEISYWYRTQSNKKSTWSNTYKTCFLLLRIILCHSFFYHDESIQKPYIHSTSPTSDAILLEILPWHNIFASIRSCLCVCSLPQGQTFLGQKVNHDTLRCSTIYVAHYNTAQYDIVQCNTVQCSTM